MWSFKKPVMVDDNTRIVMPLVPFDNKHPLYRAYPLEMEDAERFDKEYQIATEIIQDWITQDIVFTRSSNNPIESSLVYQLMNLPICTLAFEEQVQILSDCLRDTRISVATLRMFDMITRLNTRLSIEFILVLTGKFLYSVLYGLPQTYAISNQEIHLPDKMDWANLLQAHPWIPFLTIIQKIYDFDESVRKLQELRSLAKPTSTIANP